MPAAAFGCAAEFSPRADLSCFCRVFHSPSVLSPPYLTALQDQGMCGGCWSFSAAETTESAVAIATGKLLTFSEQELIDCAPNPNSCGGTGGCNGATQEVS